MQQIKSILRRLKNPSVILSVVSQIITILMLFNVDVKADVITGIVTAACSIFVLLGILSNPTTENNGYGDDVIQCENCGKNCTCVNVKGEKICCNCGNKCSSQKNK